MPLVPAVPCETCVVDFACVETAPAGAAITDEVAINNDNEATEVTILLMCYSPLGCS